MVEGEKEGNTRGVDLRTPHGNVRVYNNYVALIHPHEARVPVVHSSPCIISASLGPDTTATKVMCPSFFLSPPGPTLPKELSEEVVYPPALRMYKWALNYASSRRHQHQQQQTTEQGKHAGGEEAMSMLSFSSSLHIPSS